MRNPGEGSCGGERGTTLEAFIHIGTRHTGTTSIQATLQANRAALAGRGVFYLSSPGERDHSVIAVCCLRAPRADDFPSGHCPGTPEDRAALLGNFHRRFADEMARLPQNARVVVSSAHLHSRLVHADEIAALRDLFAPFCQRVTIIVYLREQLDTALDSYADALRNGNAEDLSRFLPHRCRSENPFYNHYESLRKWADVFGRENLRPRLFDAARLARGELGEDFLAQVDPALSSCPITRQPPPDQPPDAFGQCLLRQLNQRLPRRHDADALSEAVTRFIVARTARRGASGVPVDEDLAATIRDRFAASNELVRREYFPRRTLLFDPGTDEFGVAEPRLTREREVLLGEILGFFTEALRSQARQLRTRRPNRTAQPIRPGLSGQSGRPEDQWKAMESAEAESAGQRPQRQRPESADFTANAGNDAGEDDRTTIISPDSLDEGRTTPAAILLNAPVTAPRH